MAQYVSNKELFREIVESKKQDELTPRAIELIIKMSNEISKLLKYKYPEDREDCIASGIADVMRYWKSFNPEKSENAFSYYSQVIKNGMAKTWNVIHEQKSTDFVSLDDEFIRNF
jgi:DNA-directed RNA polymerase specialized sigma subunit